MRSIALRDTKSRTVPEVLESVASSERTADSRNPPTGRSYSRNHRSVPSGRCVLRFMSRLLGVNLNPRATNRNEDAVGIGIYRKRVRRGRNEGDQLVRSGIHNRTTRTGEGAEVAIEVTEVSVVVAGVVPDLVALHSKSHSETVSTEGIEGLATGGDQVLVRC